MCFGFSIFDFFRFFYAYLNLGQILGLNKFKTWKWNGKHESFLTHSKMKVLENFMFETQNPSSLHMFDFIRQSLARVRGRYDIYMIFLLWICLEIDLVYQLECLLYDIRSRLYIYVLWFFIFFWIFLNFYSHLNLGQILGLTKVKTSLKHGNEKVSIWIILSLSKMKLLGGFWSFHVWNPKSLLFICLAS